LITSGELARLRDEGLTGVTSNPTIFEKAVSGSSDYDAAMVELVREKKKPADMLWALMVEDIQAAADTFRPVYDKTKGRDGFVSKVASVASFFVSRVDTKVDKILAEKVNQAQDPQQKRSLDQLFGKAAIANSKMAYEHYKELFAGPRWDRLRKAGARTQRCLWASTSTKDPRYPDTYYVEELIGPDTVDTVPPATLAAFREHGEVRRSLDENVELAHRQLKQLAGMGVDLDQVTKDLEVEGVEAFTKSFESLLTALDKSATEIKAGKGPRQWYSLAGLQP